MMQSLFFLSTCRDSFYMISTLLHLRLITKDGSNARNATSYTLFVWRADHSILYRLSTTLTQIYCLPRRFSLHIELILMGMYMVILPIRFYLYHLRSTLHCSHSL